MNADRIKDIYQKSFANFVTITRGIIVCCIWIEEFDNSLANHSEIIWIEGLHSTQLLIFSQNPSIFRVNTENYTWN